MDAGSEQPLGLLASKDLAPPAPPSQHPSHPAHVPTAPCRDAVKSIRLFNLHQQLQQSPAAWEQAQQSLLAVPPDPSFAKLNPSFDGVCMVSGGPDAAAIHAGNSVWRCRPRVPACG